MVNDSTMDTQNHQYNDKVDNRTEKEKAIDAWLPITSSRNAKWWYSAFHNVTRHGWSRCSKSPYAMSNLGWSVFLILAHFFIITRKTLNQTIQISGVPLWQMVEMHEMVPGKRFDRYHELGQHAFGEKLGLYIVVPQQLIVEVSVNIVYMVTGGKSLQKFHDLVCGHNCKDIKLTYFIMIFASVHFVLYSTIAWSASVKKGVQPNVEYGYKAKSTIGTVFNFFSALGDPQYINPGKASKGPMWKGVIVAYIVVALCYFPVALIGYWTYGNGVSDNILISLNKPTWLIAMANMFVVVHVIGSYQLNFTPSFMLRFITRNIYVALTMFIGICFPFFGGHSDSLELPCIMWLSIVKPKKWSLSWFTNWICIILGLALMIVSPIGGLRSIIVQGQRLRVFLISIKLYVRV
uniref:Putative amino acid transporter, transmembrane domain-containing protein n=1 Tax=Helianthus annuus TaxID=4232 RepID=A0A251S790_HELAN